FLARMRVLRDDNAGLQFDHLLHDFSSGGREIVRLNVRALDAILSAQQRRPEPNRGSETEREDLLSPCHPSLPGTTSPYFSAVSVAAWASEAMILYPASMGCRPSAGRSFCSRPLPSTMCEK